ncbi:hypothetical protein T11_17463 [Trichinella zimbabwensis]|uniref:Uncharacterized protein n=1 Tax=Trichinella zimbabwensis TaxID=268475 RepID=A0A0V1HDU4_9BILA|nr:hypothetical protein T11_17463 [Trichinella zimbabwensis]
MAGSGRESQVGFTVRPAASVSGAAGVLVGQQGHVGIPRAGRPLGGIIFQSALLGFELLVLLVPGSGTAGHADGVAVAGLLPALPSVDSVVLLGIAVVTVLEDNFRSFGRRARSTAVGRGSVVVVVGVVVVLVVALVVLGRTFQSRMLAP